MNKRLTIDIGIDADRREEIPNGLSRVLADTDDDGAPTALDMIRLLVEGHETVARTARDVFKIADSVSDQPTCDLLTQRMQVHEKTAWMLRSLLE
jgi:DNA-binding ferritin-like protein